LKLTLRSKLILFAVFLVTITMADVTYFFTIRELRDRRQAVEQQMKRIAENIATMKLLERQDWSDYQSYISQLMPINTDIVYIAIYDDRNWLRAHTLNTELVEVEQSPPLTQRIEADYVRRLDNGLIHEESRDDLKMVNVNIQSGDRVLGSVHVGFSLIKLNDELQSRIFRNMGLAVVFIIIFSSVAVFMSRRLSGPLERLSKAMSEIAAGNLNQKVEIENRDEIGELARSFNQMVDGLRERDRMKHELEIARQVHLRLLPDEMPKVPGYQIDGVCVPAHEVGGDYFDFFKLSDHEMGVVIADVSGKGTSASFYMAELKGMMLSMVSLYKSPRELLIKLNRRLCRTLDKQIFATMIYGVLDADKHTFTWARAGHDSLLHLGEKGRQALLTPAGLGLGLDGGHKFESTLEEKELNLSKGDFILLFTDGITEARNDNNDEFGEQRLLQLTNANGMISAKCLREKIFAEVESFQNGVQQHDDLTMVVIHCESKLSATPVRDATIHSRDA